MRYPKAKALLLLLLLGNLSIGLAQFQIPEKPSLQTSVYDYIGLLDEGQKQALEQKLIRYSDSTSTQIVLAIGVKPGVNQFVHGTDDEGPRDGGNKSIHLDLMTMRSYVGAV